MNTQTTGKITALYSRLSREDILDGDSLSIQNQRDILENYAAKNGFANTRHFFDDGTTGVHFDRDGWQQLMNEVEAGNVSTIIGSIYKSAYIWKFLGDRTFVSSP